MSVVFFVPYVIDRGLTASKCYIRLNSPTLRADLAGTRSLLHPPCVQLPRLHTAIRTPSYDKELRHDTIPVHLDPLTLEADLTPDITKSDIVAFLYANSEYGYRSIEIRNHLDIPHGNATTTLKRLHEEGYIGKTDDSYYHALDNREELRRYVVSLDQFHRMSNRATDET